MSFNKPVKTTRLEQLKSAVIVALVVGIAAFVMGMQYNSVPEIVVDNEVIVHQVDTAPVQTEAKK